MSDNCIRPEPVMNQGHAVTVSNADESSVDQWFCDQGGFWGTSNQLTLCAKCGQHEVKAWNEPRHFRDVFKPTIHHLCDECFDSLPAKAIEAR